jgi:hypothetical protein
VVFDLGWLGGFGRLVGENNGFVCKFQLKGRSSILGCR